MKQWPRVHEKELNPGNKLWVWPQIVACDSIPKGGKIGYVGTDASR